LDVIIMDCIRRTAEKGNPPTATDIVWRYVSQYGNVMTKRWANSSFTGITSSCLRLRPSLNNTPVSRFHELSWTKQARQRPILLNVSVTARLSSQRNWHIEVKRSENWECHHITGNNVSDNLPRSEQRLHIFAHTLWPE
jgi:hypothetical protein